MTEVVEKKISLEPDGTVHIGISSPSNTGRNPGRVLLGASEYVDCCYFRTIKSYRSREAAIADIPNLFPGRKIDLMN